MTLILGLAFTAPLAHAAPGDLDLNFSGDGLQTTDFSFGASQAEATVRQPDGKIVAVGQNEGNFALARYNANGSLDTSFSGDGKQTTNFGGTAAAQANAVTLQGDGKIVAVGIWSRDFALARYNPDGSLDATFSGDGKQTTDFGGPNQSAANAVALQDDGKIVAVGHRGFELFALARYNANGLLDATFSGDGKLTTSFGDAAQANAVALQGDGKIVAAGFVHHSFTFDNDFALARYNPDGSPDATFSGDGKLTTRFEVQTFDEFDDEARGVVLQGDGRILAAGRGGSGRRFALARYNPDGSLDATFSGDGKLTTPFAGPSQADAVALRGDGKIVAAGRRGDPYFLDPYDFALARYNPDGSLDTTFSGDGKQLTSWVGGGAARAVALSPNGRIVAVGETYYETYSDYPRSTFALARYNPDGSLDTTFSGDGKQTTDFPGPDDAAGVVFQGDGKIVAAGTAGRSGASRVFALARYNPSGALDTTFSGDGVQTTGISPYCEANAIALQANGRIIVAGTTGSTADDFALTRNNPSGSLDTTFSGDGKVFTNLVGAAAANAVAIQPNGRIVAVGFQCGECGSAKDFALVRYNPSGSLDTTFSGDGIQTTDFGGIDEAKAAALQGDGKVLAVGSTAAGGGKFALARYNPDGSPDTTFSGDGLQTTDFGAADDGANAVALQADGKIVVAGRGAGKFALARYNPDGSLDTTFSGDGTQTSEFPGSADAATGVALEGDGKVVAVGLGGFGGDFALARYNPNGSPDTTFSNDGKLTTDFAGESDAAFGVALRGGRILAVGAGTGETRDFALARYLGA